MAGRYQSLISEVDGLILTPEALCVGLVLKNGSKCFLTEMERPVTDGKVTFYTDGTMKCREMDKKRFKHFIWGTDGQFTQIKPVVAHMTKFAEPEKGDNEYWLEVVNYELVRSYHFHWAHKLKWANDVYVRSTYLRCNNFKATKDSNGKVNITPKVWCTVD